MTEKEKTAMTETSEKASASASATSAKENGKEIKKEPLKQYPWTYSIMNFCARQGAGAIVALVCLWILYLMKCPTWVIFLGAFGAYFVTLNYISSLLHWPYPKEMLPELAKRHAPDRPQDSSFREIVETIVFVVVLVLLLKSFAAEAFVIPTGSMAETLYGYQKEVECPSCGFPFPVNASKEAEPKGGIPTHVDRCTCPNCRQRLHLVLPDEPLPDIPTNRDPNTLIDIADPGWKSGDRVLVAKWIYDLFDPNRLDVVVFKYPKEPQENHVQMNYIKRLIGLSGETIAVRGGDLYFLPPKHSPTYPEPDVDPKDLWQSQYMHAEQDTEEARSLFKDKPFQIIRKSPKILLEMRRIVYDHDFPAKDLQGEKWERWRNDDKSNWKAGEDQSFSHSGGSQLEWLRYWHVIRPHDGKPSLITDFMSYNYEQQGDLQNWVGDLLLECEVDVEKAQGELVLELRKGVDTFKAQWDLSSGLCTLYRNAEKLDSKPTDLTSGNAKIRFANMDRRLTVWVDGDLPFGHGVVYGPPAQEGPEESDLAPVGIGIKGAPVKVSHLRLWRDSYHTIGRASFQTGAPLGDVSVANWTDSNFWGGLKRPPVLTMYVQPGHYLCLGDNSPQSADSRSWGLVPERLLLGRALMVYWPFGRAGRIR